MRNLFLLVSFIFFLSCNFNNEKPPKSSLKEWILSNHRQLELDAKGLISGYLKENGSDSNWTSASIATTMYAPNSLGMLARIAGDSTKCIVVELTFYKDTLQKKEIMLAAEDSTCLQMLNTVSLETDSTNQFIFGKKTKPLF
jgi:hypothetical protein